MTAGKEKPSLNETLERARRELLDLTARNRLLHVPRDRAKSGRIDIVRERADDIYRLLVQDGRSMSFLVSKEPAPPDPDEDEAAYTDDALQTSLEAEVLEKRLLRMYYDARTFEDEQGSNILFLAIGFLRWHDRDDPETVRHAPLLLVPVRLERRKAGGNFTLSYDETELSQNLSLAEKLKEFGVELPELPEPDELVPSKFFADVRSAVAPQASWEVDENGIVLWFFSFAKFLMFRDLQPEAWPEPGLAMNPMMQALLREGFPSAPSAIAEDANLDRTLRPRDLLHIVDADSSQTVAIEEVQRGRSLVIQGPPGTGKSQTIANILAGAIARDRKVLFVAEKTAALQVVKQRLDAAGLGAACLELHSHKANKVAILEELRRTLELAPPTSENIEENAESLRRERERLNEYVEALHSPLMAARVTAFEAMGALLSLNEAHRVPLEAQHRGVETWTRADLDERRRHLEQLALALEYVGVPASHPCRGVHAAALLPNDKNRILQELLRIPRELTQLEAEAADIAALLGLGAIQCLGHATLLAQRLRLIAQAPNLPLGSVASPAWDGAPHEAQQLIAAGLRLAALVPGLTRAFTEGAWSSDVSAIRAELSAHAGSLLRWVSGDFREAEAALNVLLRTQPAPPLDECVTLLDQLIEAQRIRHLLATTSLGPAAFGALWRGEASSFDALAALANWIESVRPYDLDGSIRRAAAHLGSAPPAAERLQGFELRLSQIYSSLQGATSALALDIREAFGVATLSEVPLATLRERFSQWLESPMILDRWCAYAATMARLPQLGLDALLAPIANGAVSSAALVRDFEISYFEAVLRKAHQSFPALSAFEGATHSRSIERFRALDRERLRLTQLEVRSTHLRRLPREQGDAGEIGTLRREMGKKRRHLPLRKLFVQARHSIQAVKPVFMMSPISAAQFLEPGGMEFDLLVIDEASQILPVDALGVIARAKQIVVVGDEKQLPPTEFFQRLGSTDDDAAEEESIGDVQSILGLCIAQGVPARMLRWHYRSRHHSLIAVSNREFYDGRLLVPPSPEQANQSRGLGFEYVADGCFDRGGSAKNQREAELLAQHVLEHARRTPEVSLGVGTFSVAQRDAVLDAVERLRKAAPELENFCARRGQDEFFVKNLESIQGDERDVIFISVGYGKDSSGSFSMNFGPLNNEGGERRLNVLITRARERCVVFSSIRAEEIDVQRSGARGVAALKHFLEFAATGKAGENRATPAANASPFEQQVADAVRSLGYAVETAVGEAGFLIDLAVCDPESPGKFLLGIECDGREYVAARCARDRDRLRPQILEARGWQLTRVWIVDWFRDSAAQTKRLAETLVAAKERQRLALARTLLAAPPVSATEPESEEPSPLVAGERSPASVASNYVEASFAVPNRPIPELTVEDLASVVEQLLQVEAPIHRDEVARRVATLWGRSRAGTRIQSAVNDALRWLSARGTTTNEGDFFELPGKKVMPRNRAEASSSSLRKAEYLPPSEVRSALRLAIEHSVGMEETDALTEALRLMGLKSAGGQLRQVVLAELRALLRANAVVLRDERYYPR